MSENTSNDWSTHRIMVMKSLENVENGTRENTKAISAMRIELATMNVKVGMISFVSAVSVSTILTLIITFIFSKLS